MGFGLIRGVDVSGLARTTHVYCQVGCRGTSMGTAVWTERTAGQTAPTDVSICAYNSFLGLDATGENVIIGNEGNGSPGVFFVQNEWENKAAVVGGMMTINCAFFDFKNLLFAYNTTVGQRVFVCYNDEGTTNYTRRFCVELFNYWDRWANKNDLLTPQDGTRRGGWPTTMGVKQWGNYRAEIMCSLPGSNFFSEFDGIGGYEPVSTTSYSDNILFIRRASATGDSAEIAGNGNGNYNLRPGSPLLGLPNKSGKPSLLKWDLAGNPRENNDSAGAYTLPQNSLRPKTRARRVASLR
jgi:hypothetical protein